MKKTLLTLATAILTITSTMAVPARRGVTTWLAQPDGTKIEASLAGDEYLCYYTNCWNQRLAKDKDGYWCVMSEHEIKAQDIEAAQRRSTSQMTAATPITKGSPNMLVILVQFPDLQFTQIKDTKTVRENYEAFFNGEGQYSANASQDDRPYSVAKYFADQSFGAYTPKFEVCGPITVSQGYAYYGQDNGNTMDVNWRQMLTEAFDLVKNGELAGTDITSHFDSNSDGIIDGLCVVYAGYGQNQQAPDNTIWPKASSNLNVGDYVIGRYFVTPELDFQLSNKVESPYLAGIGTACHEFSHTLGLPDYYDTQYQVGDAACFGMDVWSVMDQGCYNDNSERPCNYTALDRMLLGWQDIDPLPTDQDSVVILPTSDDIANHAFRYVNPSNENEYWVFECHTNAADGWDAYWGQGTVLSGKSYSQAQQGMLITHVDYINSWNSGINNTASHQRYSVVPADGVRYPYGKVNSSATSKEYLYSLVGDKWPGSNWFLNENNKYQQGEDYTSGNALSNEFFTFYTSAEDFDFAIDDCYIQADGSVVMKYNYPSVLGISNVSNRSNASTEAKVCIIGGELMIRIGDRTFNLNGIER
ncbi:MAG: M6 family metalloprotease domain-containing protein [Bacteroidales bacterium]|nr:M6 family metalloprotease domain-containing protein [Candidatus Liminaster caballi]